MLLPLAQNISFVVLLTIAFSAFRHRLGIYSSLPIQLAAGVAFGMGAMVGMASALRIADGILLDSRYAMIAVGTVVGGPIAGLITAAISGCFLWYLGGVGLEPAWAVMIVTLILSSFFWWLHRDDRERFDATRLAALGLFIGVLHLLGFFLLPVGIPAEVIPIVAFPILLLTPGMICLAGLLMEWERQREELRGKLSSANHRFELAIEGSQDGVFDYDTRTRKLWSTLRHREMRGYQTAPELTDLSFWRDMVVPEDRAVVENEFADLEAGRIERIDMMMRVRHRSGRIVHLRSTAVAEKSATGAVVRVVGANADETKRVEAEARLRDAIDSMESGFAYFDIEDRLVLCNQGFIDSGMAKTLGNPVGRTFEDIMRAFSQAALTAVNAIADPDAWLRWRIEQHRTPPLNAIEIQWTDGSWLSVLERRTSDGGCVGLWTDITDQKRRAAEIVSSRDRLKVQAIKLTELAKTIEIARIEADRANREKSRFLASMSHELRTPLNAVIGFADIMKNEILGPVNPPKYAEYVSMICDGGDHLLSLVNDILDLSKIETGHMKLEIELLSTHDLCRQVLGLTRELAGRTQIDLTAAVQEGCTMLLGDSRAVRQILLNLVSNAIKFTEPGGAVHLDISGDAEGTNLTVSDNGVGMNEAEVALAVEPYGQLNSTMARNSKGTGLGLPIAKGLAELHGGRLSLSSSKGKGTKVLVALPWKTGPHSPSDLARPG